MQQQLATAQQRIEELKERLDSGDTLLVTELSRLGRSTIDLLSIIKALRDKGLSLEELRVVWSIHYLVE